MYVTREGTRYIVDTSTIYIVSIIRSKKNKDYERILEIKIIERESKKKNRFLVSFYNSNKLKFITPLLLYHYLSLQ